eukprot:COSAG02_NODE_28793_length_582_cov_1.004141_1_plen_64_part_01
MTAENYAGEVVTEERLKWPAVLTYWREEGWGVWTGGVVSSEVALESAYAGFDNCKPASTNFQNY